MRRTSPLWTAAAAALFAVATAGPALAARQDKTVDRSLAAPRALELENLAGAVALERAAGAELRIVGHVQGEADGEARARELVDSLEVRFEQKGDRLVVSAVYPLDRYRRYSYPRNGEQGADVPWPLSWLIDAGSSTVTYRGERVTVVGRPSDSAPTLFVDFRIEVPEGMAVTVKNAVGAISSRQVAGDQSLDTASGDVGVADGRGALRVDTGSGDVTVTGHAGDVSADTGSGDVRLERVKGDAILADTGSGNVELIAVEGAVDANTGSGDVTGRDLVLGARLRADTGSGDVRLEGDFSAVTDLSIDTGSGDVALTVGRTPSLRLTISTGSGDVEVDLPDSRLRKSHGDFIAELGSARGRGLIDTGSGDVRLRPGA